MKKENQKNILIALSFFVTFILWTILVSFADVKEIGPRESSVGFATLNRFVHNLTGVNMTLYNITDWLGLVPLCFAIGFAFFGLIQWIRRKKLRKVDYSILVLGGFYIIVLLVYVLFEIFVVNYRPVLISGYLEASYPSSTTMLVMCIMPTAIIEFNARIRNRLYKQCINTIIIIFVIFMVIGRLLSGVHWFTDIVGGVFLSTGLVMFYRFLLNLK